MKVHNLLSSEERWMRNGGAQSEAGFTVDPASDSAVRWSVFGALHRCYPSTSDRLHALLTIQDCLPAPFTAVRAFNRVCSYSTLRALLLRAKV